MHSDTRLAIVPYFCIDHDMEEALNRAHPLNGALVGVLEGLEVNGDSQVHTEHTVDELIRLAEDAPIVRAVNILLQAAATTGASDIHIEPKEHHQ